MNRPVIVAPGGSYEKAVIASKYGAEELKLPKCIEKCDFSCTFSAYLSDISL